MHCGAPSPDIESSIFDADIIVCPQHGKFGVIRASRATFDRLDVEGKSRAIERAKRRFMIFGYPIVDDFSV